jgi:probable phosphoglycerate mutase
VTDLTSTQLVGRTPGVPLNQAGLEQAGAVVARLAALDVAAVYSSPMQRAMETAAPLAQARGLTVVEEPGLIEVEYGEWTAQPYKSLRRTDLWKRVQDRPADARFPGGEAIREVQARAVAAVERLAQAHPDQTVAAFSHGDVIKAAVAHLVGLHLDLFQRIGVTPGSITAVLLGQGQPRLLRLNETGDLSDLRPPKRRGR